MSSSGETAAAGLRLKLPATSANLGPGFDTLALALALYLEIEAEPAGEFSIQATGRNQELCSRLEENLLLSVYQDTVRRYSGAEATPLALTVRNGIPLGMGCGSSAASRLAAVALASHFGGLGWSRAQILDEGARLEGHPDNAAACWLGGFVASGWEEQAAPGMESPKDGRKRPAMPSAHIAAISIAPPSAWHALLVLPAAPLATTSSRAVLPDRYSRRDAVLNLQRATLLTAAFARGRGDLLRSATGDSFHQPFRAEVCPLLPLLLPLAGRAGILSITLSGAGPAVLLLLEGEQVVAQSRSAVLEQVAGHEEGAVAEILACSLSAEAAEVGVMAVRRSLVNTEKVARKVIHDHQVT